ncbi:MAG TPA: hypothetical protein VIS74_00925 [Chthoniobacterales bacterium]
MDVSNINSSTLQNLVGLIKKKEELELQLGKIEAQIAAAISGKKAGKPGRPALKGKPGRPAKAAPKRSGKRGALKEAITDLLGKAGPEGISAKEISEKLGVPNQHVHVWFGTTGKKITGLTKLAKGVWAVQDK